MSILTIQRRLREVGRIRMGEQVATSGGKRRPVKLDTFRLTSRDEQVIRSAAALFGGSARPWESPDGAQWEVVTEASEMPVIVPPGDMAMSQWYEMWSGGGCVRRCDGVTETIGESPCQCDPDDRECKPTTRLNVMVPGLPGLGLWRLESHGFYAAVELAGAVELCATAGRNLPARLRIEQRSVKRDSKTARFAVPVLDLDVPIGVLTGIAPAATAAAELPAGEGWQPIPQAALGEAPSIAEQIAAVDDPASRPRRANAAVQIPPTGIEPRTAIEASETAPEPEDEPDAATPALASAEEVDELRHELDQMSPELTKALRAWWRQHKIPSLASGALTSDQVAAIVTQSYHLTDSLEGRR